MGSRSSGRRPRSSHLKALEGAPESRLNRDEPIPSEGIIVPPVELPEDAQAVWNRLAGDLISRRVLTAWDCDAFAAYCRAVALFNRAAEQVEREGASTERPYKGQVASPAFRAMVAAEKMASSIGSRFGLTPADRATLKVDPDAGPRSGSARLLDGYVQ
jgi:P27 family predicted phage terminase small subunit